MWSGKKKAVTFSFDDAVTQDERVVAILNKYGLKGTFNLNSGFLGCVGGDDGYGARHDKVLPSRVKGLYDGHEVAVHTLVHPNLTQLSEEAVIRQVEEDRKALSALVGYDVFGMAYPCGGVNNDDRVADILRKHTPIRYSRTITSTHNFDLQENLLRFNPTIHWIEPVAEEVIDRFLSLQAEEPQLLYIWGHAYELDWENGTEEKFERFCKKLSDKADVFYGTNREVLL